MEQITVEQQSSIQGMGAGLMIFIWALILVMVISQWKIYSKAGQPGWACIIPIYNLIVYFRIIGRPASWLLVYLGCIVLYIAGVAMLLNQSAMGGILTSLGGLALLIISIIDTNRLSKSFGKGAGFTVGLLLLSFIFYPILAFGDASYIGPNGVGEAANDNPDILHN